jgi:Uma2 family endonuclease
MSDPALDYDRDRGWTYADYKDWELKPGERFELIDGAAYAMAAPNTEHQTISTILVVELYTFLKGKPCRVLAAPFDVRLFYQEDGSDDTVVQPDLVVVCDPAKLGKEGCRGAPDLAVEILSPSNTVIEMLRKLNLYLDAGVREYWVIDPEHKMAALYCLTKGRYTLTTLRIKDSIVSEALPGLALPLEGIFPPDNTE